MNTYIPKKSNDVLKYTYKPSLHAFFNTNLDYNKVEKFKQRKKKFMSNNERINDAKDEKTKKMEILLKAKNKEQKHFDKKVKNHLKPGNYLKSSNSVRITFIILAYKRIFKE